MQCAIASERSSLSSGTEVKNLFLLKHRCRNFWLGLRLESPYTWCFVDSINADQLPEEIFDPLNRLFPIYVTSPKSERWAKLHQLRLPTLFIMNPWTRA